MSITPQRAFELGALAMRQLASAKCGNEMEGLQEDAMTSGGLTREQKKVMHQQVEAIGVVDEAIMAETVAQAAYYGSYILGEQECREIKTLFPELNKNK